MRLLFLLFIGFVLGSDLCANHPCRITTQFSLAPIPKDVLFPNVTTFHDVQNRTFVYSTAATFTHTQDVALSLILEISNITFDFCDANLCWMRLRFEKTCASSDFRIAGCYTFENKQLTLYSNAILSYFGPVCQFTFETCIQDPKQPTYNHCRSNSKNESMQYSLGS